MKILVNYVIQEAKEHRHESEILEIQSPPYTFSPEPPAEVVWKWVEKKQSELANDGKIILTSMYKI